ncbi:MAG: hypothetical protein HOE90_13685 [Bacteriovoracaceae bacterium]|jgi:hypothetical protein|nr:hypothetical protein [Bacteriovoracaceae bacterium]
MKNLIAVFLTLFFISTASACLKNSNGSDICRDDFVWDLSKKGYGVGEVLNVFEDVVLVDFEIAKQAVDPKLLAAEVSCFKKICRGDLVLDDSKLKMGMGEVGFVFEQGSMKVQFGKSYLTRNYKNLIPPLRISCMGEVCLGDRVLDKSKIRRGVGKVFAIFEGNLFAVKYGKRVSIQKRVQFSREK